MAYLKFSIPSFRRGEMVQHQSQTFYRNWLRMFTNHRPPRSERLVSEHYWHSLKVRHKMSVSGAWWSLCITGHCHQESLFPITMLFLMLSHSPPPISWSSPMPRFAPSAHGAGRRSLGSVTRLKTQQFRGELYRYNIHTETLIHLVEIISVWWIT